MQVASRRRGRIRRWLLLEPLSRGWRAAIFAAGGAALGLAIVAARIANATSYLSDAPGACINCHVMTDAYATWERGSHGLAAACSDCHVPHTGLAAAYAFKAADGGRHSYVFTLRREPQVLRLSRGAEPVIQANCLRCHGDLVAMTRPAAGGRRCWDCHMNIHGRSRSLSSSPAALRPRLPPAGLDWMKKGLPP
ncbi:MAG: cytochrome c nitrite reductase small subunit [Planctomycetes bacterium]|nr:cytochrome c nitrite reductase small subunit [Planctomycetota bacterium]